MTRAEVLQALEAVSYAERVRFMIALGRRQDEESRAVVAELERGGFYERLLALHSCVGSRDLAHVMHALADPSRRLRHLALRLFPLDGDAAQIQDALKTAPAQMRARLIRKVRKHALAAVDAFLETAPPDDPHFFQLLALGSSALVKRHATAFQQRAALADWRVLARFHPELALDLLQAWAESVLETTPPAPAPTLPIDQLQAWANTANTAQARLAEYINTLLPMLARRAPARTLRLVQTTKRFALASIDLTPLAAWLPGEVADLALAEKGAVQVDFIRVAKRLSTGQVIALCKERPNLLEPDSGPWNPTWFLTWNWFLKLAPAQRLAVYNACRAQWRSPHSQQQGYLPPQVVAALPRAQREAEARQHIDNEQLPFADRLLYAALLPWEEMMQVVEAALASNDEQMRARALRALIGAVRYHRDRLSEVLARLRVGEEGSARIAVLETLGSLPASIWQKDHLAVVRLHIRRGEDGDEYIHLKLAWLAKLMLVHTDWAAWEFNVLLHDTAVTPQARIVATLPTQIADRLLQYLMNLMYVWSERGYPEGAAGTLQAFLTHKQALMRYVPLLEEIVQERTEPRYYPEGAEQALRLLSRLQPERWHRLIPAMVRSESVWVSVPTIAEYLLKYRQDLLTPFLEYGAYAGGDITGEKDPLFTLRSLWSAGTAMQQERLADALMQVIRRQGSSDEQVKEAIRSLALLPAISPARLLSLMQDSRPQVSEEARRALRRIDAPSA